MTLLVNAILSIIEKIMFSSQRTPKIGGSPVDGPVPVPYTLSQDYFCITLSSICISSLSRIPFDALRLFKQ